MRNEVGIIFEKFCETGKRSVPTTSKIIAPNRNMYSFIIFYTF